MRLLALLYTANRRLDTGLQGCTAAAAVLFFFVVITGVLSRYVVQRPLLAAIELSRLFFVWACFLAAALAYRRRAHVAFELLFEKLPTRLRHALSLLGHGLVLLFCGVVGVSGARVTWWLWPTDLSMLQTSQGWLFLPVPLVCLVIALFAVERMAEEARSRVSAAQSSRGVR